ncbi:4Fe-4S dicluster domain-containing protein [Helicobacter aurati]|uniref:4Fe-4S dicluster domain-containing protein n=1 Tax=Helicobacter aurati TaxID=137778 RepID=A0A3D8J4C6_9HELI|nr:4Fe-4S binding protein [Helicobacter aurati]RDU71631.1 4Fe-4S dicluster domain-containing protein [Helicobacter aurati]
MLFINRNCIACDACKEVCPTQAIYVADPIYIIKQERCIMCKGYSSYPECITVCPMDAIVYEDSKENSSKHTSRN